MRAFPSIAVATAIAFTIAFVSLVPLAGAAAEPDEARRPDAAGVEDRPALAAPGRCAEPRQAVDVRTGDALSVVGPVAALFDPIDVAGAPGEGGPLALLPTPRPLVRPGACDQPGSGCRAAIETGRVIEPPPFDPSDPPPPGFGGAAASRNAAGLAPSRPHSSSLGH